MSPEPTTTVTYKGREDDAPSASLTVRVDGKPYRLPRDQKVEVPRAVAARCEELRETYTFEIHGLQAAGSSSSSSRSAAGES